MAAICKMHQVEGLLEASNLPRGNVNEGSRNGHMGGSDGASVLSIAVKEVF